MKVGPLDEDVVHLRDVYGTGYDGWHRSVCGASDLWGGSVASNDMLVPARVTRAHITTHFTPISHQTNHVLCCSANSQNFRLKSQLKNPKPPFCVTMNNKHSDWPGAVLVII